MNKIFKFLYYVFLGAVGIIALAVIVSAFPVQGNVQIKIVQSGSMEPAIKVGSLVLIRPAEAYNVGDIITFDGNFKDDKGNKIPITHRIIETKGDGSSLAYVTKGDANEDPDDKPILDSNVFGKVILSIPYAGYAVQTAKEPYGFLALILIPSSIIIWDEGMKISGALRERRKKTAQETIENGAV